MGLGCNVLTACLVIVLTLALVISGQLSRAQVQTTWNSWVNRLSRDPELAKDFGTDSDRRTRLVAEAKTGGDAMIVPVLRQIASHVGKDGRVTVSKDSIVTLFSGNKAALAQVNGQWS